MKFAKILLNLQAWKVMCKKGVEYLLNHLRISSLIIVFSACAGLNNEEVNEDLFYVHPNIREVISKGIEVIPEAEKVVFYEKLEMLLPTDELIGAENSGMVQQLMDTEEYINLKNYVLSGAPESYYLLIDVYLQGEVLPGSFRYMFQDIAESKYPGIISKVMDRLEGATTEQFVYAYPQVYVEFLLEDMQNE